jgi:hypothetical protein
MLRGIHGSCNDGCLLETKAGQGGFGLLGQSALHGLLKISRVVYDMHHFYCLLFSGTHRKPEIPNHPH